MVGYKAITIFTGEEARSGNKPVSDVVIDYVRGLKIAARCMVVRGHAGCYENGEVATDRLEVLSYNMPICITIVVPEGEADEVLNHLDAMITEGLMAIQDLHVVRHKAKQSFFPRQLRVQDVMTLDPKSVLKDSPLSEAAKLVLSSVFTGLPVVDTKGKPLGIITQGDLIQKGGMPLRLGLLAESDENRLASVLKMLSGKRAEEVMTAPAVIIEEGQLLSDAVDRMLSKNVKRLPVVDDAGRLTGMLSRLDIFRTVMRESPNWKSFKTQNIQVDYVKRVGDILRRDIHTVLPETAIEEVIRVIDQNDIQRVAVIDDDGKLLGLISDRDLLCFFKTEEEGIWKYLSKVKPSLEKEKFPTNFQKRLAQTKAKNVMNTSLITVDEDMSIEDAIRIMAEMALKRLPVVDGNGRFKGMISRDSLLRTGFGANPRGG
jgi:CBS domain-containing protein/PII-like signaling protein